MLSLTNRNSFSPYRNLGILGLTCSAWGVFIFSEWRSQAWERSHKVINWLQKDQRSTDSAEIQVLFQKINDCPPAKELWDKARSKGEISVHLGSKFHVPAQGFWEPTNRVIALDRNLSLQEKFQRLLFETTKEQREVDQTAIFAQAKEGNLTQNEFLQQMVLSEYNASKALGIADACSNLKKIESEKPFEDVWANYLTDPLQEKHRETHRHQWVKLAQNAYCKKHPEVSDCASPPGEDLKTLLSRGR